MAEPDRMLKWFDHAHLPEPLQAKAVWFQALAQRIVRDVPAGPERTVALRKLVEAKDACIRACVHPGG